jgi:hypothetical protein
MDTTRAPSASDLAAALGQPVPSIERSLLRLAAHHHLVLAPGAMSLWMAHPFSVIPTEFPVDAGPDRYWANCAWDALGIPAVLQRETWTQTRCAETGVPIAFGIREGKLEAGTEVVHFAVPACAFYENVAYT